VEICAVIQISVKFGVPLWREVGARTLQLEWPEAPVSLADVMRRLHKDYPGFSAAFAGKGLNANHPYRLFVNAHLVHLDQAKTTQLKDGDRVYVFIPVVGG
jgi:DNA-3-methyladenine glycosylase